MITKRSSTTCARLMIYLITRKGYALYVSRKNLQPLMFNLARNHDPNQFSRDDLVKRADCICNRLRKNQIRDQLSHRVNINIDSEDSLPARAAENESMKTGC